MENAIRLHTLFLVMVLFTLFGFFALNKYRSRKKHAKDGEWGEGALSQYGKKIKIKNRQYVYKPIGSLALARN